MVRKCQLTGVGELVFWEKSQMMGWWSLLVAKARVGDHETVHCFAAAFKSRCTTGIMISVKLRVTQRLLSADAALTGDVVVHHNRDDRGTEPLHAFAHIKSRPEDALPKVKGCSLVPCFPDPGSCRPKRLCHATNYYNPARCVLFRCVNIHWHRRRTTTTTILQPIVRDYPGEPVPEDTLTHPPSWSSSNLYQLLLSTTIDSILPVHIACLAICLHNLSPRPFWSTSWSGALHLIFHTFLHPISVFFSQHT